MKIFKRILKYFIWSISVIAVLLIGLYFFIQTETFNKWALNFALDKLNNSDSWLKKENSINIESINGNILKGLRVNNVVITVKKDTLASIKYLDLKYDIWGLLKQKIGIDFMVLNSPEINLVKIKGDSDSLVWNFTNLFTPSTDTTPSQFNWDIYVNSFRIESGKIRILGDIPSKPLWALQWERKNEFDFNKLDISDFQLDMSGEYSKKFKKINLRNLSFSSNTDVTFKKLIFEVNVNVQDTLTEILNLELLTDRSDIKLKRFSVNALNPLDSNAFNNIENKKLSLILNIEKFDFTDLKYFIPSVDMLGSISSLYLDASGIYKNFNVNNLIINLPNSNINLNGNVKNLDNMDSLYFDLTSSNKINPADIKTIYNSKSIPDFRNLGIVLADFDYKGRYYDFYSNFNIRSSGGNIRGQGHLNINDKFYSGNVITNNLDLALMLNDKKLKSNINLDARFEGTGFSLNTMSTGVKYQLGSSSAAGYNIASSSGTVNINRNNINLNIKANSSAGNVVVSGRLNISDMKNPVYSIRGTMNNVDVSRLSRNNKDKSNLNAEFDINGSGSNMDNLAGRFDFNIGNSFYSQYEIPKTNLIAKLRIAGDSSSLQLTNKAMEVRADGTFSLFSLIDVILYNISMVSNIAEKKLNPDTSINYTNLSRYNHTGNLNFNYEFVTKDSAELRKLSAPFGIIFNGELSGSLSNSSDRFNSKSVIYIKNFRYQDTSIVLNNLKSDISLTNDYVNQNNSDPLSSFKINMDVNADKIRFSSYKLDSIKAELSLSKAIANLKVRGKMDSVKYLRLISEIDMRGNDIVMNVDSLYAKYNTYDVINNNRWTIIYIPQSEVQINQLGLKSGKMILNVDGVYSFTGSSDININGENLNIGEIYAMIQPFDTTETGEKTIFPVQGEFQNFSVNLTGTPDKVNINLDVKSNLLKYDTMSIGTVAANLKYKDRILSPDIMITNNGNKGNLKITGNIPFENIFIQKDTTAAVADKLSDVHLAADNFQIQYFSKFIPGIGDLRGVLNGTLDATGTLYNPELKGNLTMVQGKYFLDFTGMYYDYKFRISTEKSNLVVDYFSLYNPNDDTKHIDLFGNINFKGYNLNGINLTTSGDMVILDKNSKENQLGLKGYLLGGIGNPPVTISGNMKKLNVKGQFLVKEASIMSLPNSGKGYQIDDKNMVYLSANDSVLTSDTNRRRVSLNEYKSLNPFIRNRYFLVDTSKNFSIMNILAIDVTVKTVKNLYVSIDFKNLTRDRLYGDVSADLRIRSDSGRLRARGEVDIVGNSYYRFYRYFKVKNSKITFRGPINKPELDIRAVYENTKSTNQFGTITNSPIQVVLTVTGEPSNPETTLRLYENGTEMLGNDATSDAITFLLFGKYKNELSASESQSVASGIGSTVGSLYVTSFFGQVVRDILPFIKDAELNYSEGGIQNTSVNASTDILDANVTIGSRVIANSAYLEFNVEYPVNALVHLDLPEKVLLHIAREQLSRNVISNTNVYYSTGMKIIYKIKF
jgi:hypothetical protein